MSHIPQINPPCRTFTPFFSRFSLRLAVAVPAIIIMLVPFKLQAGTLDGSASAAAGSIAIGDAARADGDSAVAIGVNSFVNAGFGTAVGASTNANSIQTTALGSAALADQPQATALGSFAQAIGEFSTAVGGAAQIEAQGGTALGANSFIEAANGTALGLEAYVTEAAVGAVALGSGSVADEANTVSVGDSAAGVTRRITNVAPAVNQYDAVNLGQFEQGLQGVRDEAFAGIAAAAAFNPATPSAPGKTAVSMGAAGYRGEHAVSVSVSHRVLNNRNNLQLNGGVAYDSSEHALGRVGVSWEF
ncbi:MAG: YadA-like family protein [Thiolinea sp.]